MRKYYLLLFFSAYLLQSHGQNVPDYIQEATDVETLEKLAKEFKQESDASYERALELAEINGWPLQIGSGAEKATLIGVDKKDHPVYIESHNVTAARSLSTDKVQAINGNADFNLSGLGMEMGIWEAADVPRITHQELVGRITVVDVGSSVDQHATHVAGTLIGAGVVANARGMAYNGRLRAFEAFGDESEAAIEAANGMILSNHSYGQIGGWWQNPSTNTWHWLGDPNFSEVEDQEFGKYNGNARNWDQVAYAAPFYLPVVSAGNDRGDGPGGAVTHVVGTQSPAGPTSNIFRPDDGPYDILNGKSLSKNLLSVGAVNDVAQGYNGPSSVSMSSFSCWGPTDDGRIKPDICGNGVSVFSASNQNDQAYASLQGTSMSGPNVAGSVLLLQEHFRNINGVFMRADLLKSLVLHTADECGSNPGPDYSFGWGLMNTEKAARTISMKNRGHVLEQFTLNNRDTITLRVVAKDTLWATLVWTDPAGNISPNGLDLRDTVLVHDLDLRITDSATGTEYFPWRLDVTTPTAAATKGDNGVDNVEKVEFTPVPGNVYFVQVTHKGNLTTPTQNFGITVSGIEAETDVHCGNFEINNFTGAITDGSGPGFDYSNNINCTWYINTNDPARITSLAFDSLDVAAGDTIYIYDGSSSADPLLAKVSGATIPAPIVGGDEIFVEFITDNATTAKGFQLRFLGSKPPQVSLEVNSTSTCVGNSIDFEAVPEALDTAGYTYLWTLPGSRFGTYTDRAPQVEYITPGIHDVTLEVTNAAGTLTIDSLNFITIVGEIPFTFTDSFQNASFPIDSATPNESWQIFETNTNHNWEYTTTTGLGDNSCIRIRNAGIIGDNRRSLVTPLFDISTLSSQDLFMSFDYSYIKRTASSADTLKFFFSSDCGRNWVPLRTGPFPLELYSDDLVTSSFTFSGDWLPFTPSQWANDTFDLIQLTSFNEIQIRLEMRAGGGNILYIDNFRIFSPTSINPSDFRDQIGATIYPNPISEESILKFTIDRQQAAEIEILDASGRIVSRENLGTLASGLNNISLTKTTGSLAPGIYSARLKLEEGIAVIKFVK